MSTELVGPIRKSMGVGCMRKLYLSEFGEDAVKPKHRCWRSLHPDYPQDPICICPCHGMEYQLSDELAEWFGLYIDREI